MAGAASGVLDVAMNTAGINYQQRCGVQILSRLHGGYSLGVLAGAGSAVIATSAKASVVEHFCVMAAALAMLVAIAAPALWQ
ncbi:hypothetical protein WG915_07370 [Corynebacterium sp. H128]|uniref:hypothetical protein n=1 Tax=unclassified Corynebacterium TaxID=2624378 RepID=UPI0030AB13A5